MEKQILAAGYVRVSTPIQVKEGESLSTQREQIRNFVKSRGWQLIEEYSDEGLSGAKSESRPGLQQLLKDAKAGKFSVVVFSKLSRFARNARDYQNLSYELEKAGVLIISIKEGIDKSTQTGRLIAGILSLFAEWEHETIREQMFENKMIRWRQRRSFVGKPPFGYAWNKTTKELEIVPEEAEIYNRIVNMYVNQHLAMRDIAIKLNAEGLKCKRAVFNAAVISYILKNPCYYGSYTVNRHVYVDGPRGAGTKRTKTLKPESEAIEFPIPAIIGKPEWDRIQEATRRNKVKVKHKGEFTDLFFLRNVLKCGVCGGKLQARIGNRRKDGTAPRYYVCYWAGTSRKSIESGRKNKCQLPFIPADYVERQVWNKIMLLFTLNPTQSFGKVLETESYEDKIQSIEKTISRLQTKLKTKERTRERLYKMTELDECDLNDLNKRLRLNKEEILSIEGNLSENMNAKQELTEKIKKQQERKTFVNEHKENLERLRKEINTLEPADKKILVEAMLESPVTVHCQYEDPKHPEDGAGPVVDFRIRFNPEIIKRFIDEGKLLKLNQNSPFNNATTHSRRGSRNNQDTLGSRQDRQ